MRLDKVPTVKLIALGLSVEKKFKPESLEFAVGLAIVNSFLRRGKVYIIVEGKGFTTMPPIALEGTDTIVGFCAGYHCMIGNVSAHRIPTLATAIETTKGVIDAFVKEHNVVLPTLSIGDLQ